MIGQGFRISGRAILSETGLGAVVLAGVAAAQSANKSFDDAFRALKRENGLQFEMPDVPPPEPPKPPPKTPEWLKKFYDFIEAIFSGVGPILTYLFYGMLALAAALIVFYIAREVIAARRGLQEAVDEDAPEEIIPLYAPDAEAAKVLLENVDQLAAEGRYAEAVHTLLFRSIQDIDEKRPNIIRRSLTSREISALDILTNAARNTFVFIARIVEKSHFGGRDIGKSDFEACRAAYVRFTEPEAWAA